MLAIFAIFIPLQHLLCTFSSAQIKFYGLRNNEEKPDLAGFFRCSLSFLEKENTNLNPYAKQIFGSSNLT